MNALITGGAGFIGSHLADRLVRDGWQVTVLDNFLRGNKLPKSTIEQIRLIDGDVRDEATVCDATAGCDVIFHFAAILGVDVVADHPVETMETEALGMRNVSRAAIQCGAGKIIYASTSGVYGKAAIERAVDEEFYVSPNCSYSIAKRFNEIYLKSLYQDKRLDAVSIRFFNVYGPRQDSRMVIPRFFEQAQRGEPLTVYGTGGQTRDFTYIDDTIEAVVRLAEHGGGGEIVNISTGEEHTIGDVAKLIVEIAGSSSEIRTIQPPSGRYDFEVDRRLGSHEKLRRITGYAPEKRLREGLAAFWAWLQKEGETGTA